MKKLVYCLLVTVLAFFPFVLKAEEQERTKIDLSEYKTMNFKETLADEGMELKYKDYTEAEDQVTIYLFRGKGCNYCRAFLSFLNDISEEYGKYFKVVSFETYYDEANYNLLGTMSSYLGEQAGGVPYIVITDKAFPGYAESYNEQIKQLLIDQYGVKERYDVFEDYNDSIRYHLSDVAKMVIWNVVLLSIASFVVIYCVNKSNKKIMDRLDNIYGSEAKEVKKASSKKTTAKKVVKKKNAKK